jgi:hypothetical protein
MANCVIELSPDEETALNSLLSVTSDPRVKRRIRGVLLLGRDYGFGRASDEVGLSPRTLQRWVDRYRTCRNPESLVAPRILRQRYESVRTLLTELLSKDPRAFGYSTDEWTESLIRMHLASEARVSIPPPVVSRFMRSV